MPSVDDSFDPDRYRRDVLEPARRLGGVLPTDLLVRYAVPERTARDPAAFDAHVGQILRHWRALKQKRVYEQLATGLLAAHSDLTAPGRLTYHSLARRRDQDRAAARRSLDSMVSTLAASTGVVTRSTVPRLATALGDVLDEQAVVDALAAHDVTVVDAVWTLPDEPGGAARPGLNAGLRILGLQLVADAVFGTAAVRAGFRLRGGFALDSGPRLTRDQLDELRRQHAKRARNERKTALDNILATLHALVDHPAELDALLLWQLVDVLRPQVEAGLPARAIAGTATDLGLDPAEAAELALSLTQQAAARHPVHTAAQDALDAGDLRAARQLALALPEGDDLRQRIEAGTARFEALLAAADEARAQGATEAEAELLTKALALSSTPDGDLRARLWALPAPAPARVGATVQDERVELEWQPGPARTGGLRYRVVRGHGSPAATPGAGTTIAETTDQWLRDDHPPPGEPLHYTVFAARGGTSWSPGTAADGPLLVLPEVRDPELDGSEGVVQGSWRLPPGATGVVVTCRPQEPDPAGPQWPIAAGPAGFQDSRVHAGVGYHYRIHTVYVGRDEQRRVSPGVVRQVTPEIPMDAVDDLRVSVLPGEDLRVVLAWSTPEHGSVMIYREQVAPPWSPGTAVTLEELTRHGRPVSGRPEHSGGTSRITAAHREGRTFFTAMTIGAARAVVGSTVSLAAGAPVRRLRARRYEELARLRWDWPDGVQVCRISWSPGDGPGPELVAECGLRRYQDDGGFELPVGRGPTRVSVVTLRRDPGGEIVSPAVEVTVPGWDVGDSTELAGNTDLPNSTDLPDRPAPRRRTGWLPRRNGR